MTSLGPFGAYPLPEEIRKAYGVESAQELADQIGVTKSPNLTMIGAGRKAFDALQKGDSSLARALLIDKLGVTPAKADEALAKLPKQSSW